MVFMEHTCYIESTEAGSAAFALTVTVITETIAHAFDEWKADRTIIDELSDGIAHVKVQIQENEDQLEQKRKNII